LKTPTHAPDCFAHPALFYSGAEEYLAATVPFIRAGLDADEPVLVAVPADNLELVRRALGDDADRVVLHDMAVAGRNPGRIIPQVLLAFAAVHEGKPVRIIGEPIWHGRTATEYPACAQHEALINLAFAGRPATIVCPYDTQRIDPAWLNDALRTHPEVWARTRRLRSPSYGDPAQTAAMFNQPLSPPPTHAATIGITRGKLASVRRFAANHANTAGLTPERAADVALAVDELAANTIRHTHADGVLAVWTEHDDLICQLTDSGHITDPLAGRLPAAPDQVTGGRGLLIVNALCDLVRTYTRQGSTTTQLHQRIDSPPAALENEIAAAS